VTQESPERVFRLWFEEVWNAGHADLIEVYLARNGVIHALDETGADAIGPSGFRAFFDKFRAAFPDISITVDQVVAAGDTAAGRWTARLTHSGGALGIKPTGRAMTITGMSFIRVANGQVVEGWNEWDRLSLATALGTVTPVR
jgi:predicted ester cyclase